MKQVVIRRGQAEVEQVPAPVPLPGAVLVRVAFSCISAGTELSGLKQSGDPLWKRALREPAKVKKAVAMLAEKGAAHTVRAIEGKFQAGEPTGYSAAGTVIESGGGAEEYRPGDRVAVAGTGYASHAEIVSVPSNLTVPVPAGVPLDQASTATLGAISLQGVRRAGPTLGETFVVIGLGIIGQLTVQLLRAHGCRAIGIDLNRRRIGLARELGMEWGFHPDDDPESDHVARLTGGTGADGVIITAASPSDAIVSAAFQYCRRKGRVVLVGDVGLRLDRADFYRKELDFFVSTSYGPGRYDRRYEEEGLDYPVGYVRWTENRNLAEYLRLIGEGRIAVKPLIAAAYPLDEAASAYGAAREGESPGPIVLLSYPEGEEAEAGEAIPNPHALPSPAGLVRFALVGAGGFAKGTHLPHIEKLKHQCRLRAVVSRSGSNAAATARQAGAEYSTTSYSRVLEDKDVDAVIISTRHNLHASMALEALRAGKHVFLEKPLALTKKELEGIVQFYGAEDGEGPLLLTGFNRRFAPLVRPVAACAGQRSEPLIVTYRMNAGYLPRDHWTGTAEGGGRNLGEACHIYDLFTFLTGSPVGEVQVSCASPSSGYYSGRDNFVASMTFEDGSAATLTYTALGSRDLPKERMEIFVDGKAFVLDDYRRLEAYGAKAGSSRPAAGKGHLEELEAFIGAIREGGAWPIPLWQQVQATDIALRVEDLLPGN